MRRVSRWFLVLAHCVAMACVMGCRQTYDDPKEFLEKYLDGYINEKAMPRAWLNALKLKGLVFEDVRLEADYGTAVCATLRLARKSDKTVYMYAPISMYMPGKILTKEEADSCLTATVKILRIKMDNGVFAPIQKVTRHDIQGWGLLGSLRIADITKIRKQTLETIDAAGKQIDSCKTAEEIEKTFERLLGLASCRHVKYLDDKRAFQLYLSNLLKCFSVAENVKGRGRVRLFINNETMSELNEACNANGVITPLAKMKAALRKADFDVAQSVARIVLACDEKSSDANFAMGMWHYEHERWNDAERYLLRCKDSRPKDAAVWNNLALVYLKMGNKDSARMYVSEALALMPESEQIKDTLKEVEAALPLNDRLLWALKRVDYESAQSAARTVLASNENNPEANFAMGMWHYRHGRWNDAERYLLRCKDAKPNEASVWNNLALIYLKTGKLDAAHLHVRKALALRPNSENSKKTLKSIEKAMAK